MSPMPDRSQAHPCIGRLLVQVREFRDRHWRFTKEYIIKRSDYGIGSFQSLWAFLRM